MVFTGKLEKYWKLHLQVNKWNLDIFTHALPQILIITLQAEANDSFLLGKIFSKTHPQQKRGGREEIMVTKRHAHPLINGN